MCSCKLLGEVFKVLIEHFYSTFLSDGGILNQTEDTEDSQQGEVQEESVKIVI